MYKLEKDNIIIEDTKDFNIKHILECGQIFSYKKEDDKYVVYSKDKVATVIEKGNKVEIQTQDKDYFVNFFDLNSDYSQIKTDLLKFDFMKEPINFGYGIRILNQDIFEMFISFLVSQNNNIKRIQKILFAIREKYGKKVNNYYAFPTLEELSKATEEELMALGAGYRAKYIVETINQLKYEDYLNWDKLDTLVLKQKILSLYGIGPKVADCILLFAFHRADSFPVDTWMEKVFNNYFNPNNENISRPEMSKRLISIFGKNAGFAQQYLFYYQRSFIKK